MASYLDLIPKPKASTVNVGLTSPKLSTLRSILGEPRASYTGSCQPITGPFKDRIVTRSVGPFRCTGVDVAVDALKDILVTVKEEVPDLHAILGTAGMACAREGEDPAAGWLHRARRGIPPTIPGAWRSTSSSRRPGPARRQ